MSGNLLSLAGWTFLPNVSHSPKSKYLCAATDKLSQMATGWLQSIYYGIMIRAGDRRPQPGSSRYITDRRRIHIIVVSAYLLYTIYEADWDIQRASDFYQDLGVSHTAGDRDIKSRFRRMAAKYHPDKVQSSSTSDGYFLHLKKASDALTTNPALRFAYDRFGPTVLEWQHCVTNRDYLVHGLQSVLPYYGIAAVFMYILGVLGYLEWGKYWRWLLLVVMCVFELHTISRPHFPQFAARILNPLLVNFTSHPPYLPFQLIQLARKMSVTVYIAFSQIGPLLQAATQSPQSSDPEVQLRQNLNRLEATAQSTDLELARLIKLNVAPFAHDPQTRNSLQSKISNWLVKNTVQNDPMVRDAIGRGYNKRREDAPAGAKGNR